MFSTEHYLSNTTRHRLPGTARSDLLLLHKCFERLAVCCHGRATREETCQQHVIMYEFKVFEQIQGGALACQMIS